MRKFIIAALLCSSLGSYGQQVKIDGELRPRIIVSDGYKTVKLKDERTNSYISQRSRLNLSFDKDKLSTYISLQDVRQWGDDDLYNSGGIYGNTNAISLHQAYFILKPHKFVNIKTGRQLFNYDDQRILGARGWNDYQISYDAVLFQLDDTANKLDVALSWNSNNTKDLLFPTTKFRVFDFIRYERKLNNFNFSTIGILTGNTPSDTSESLYFRGTYGAYITYTIQNTSFQLSGYYQSNLNNIGKSAEAYLYSANAKQFFLDKKLLTCIGFDYLSGHDETKSGLAYNGVNHKFDLLYGTTHGFYGYMDFYSIPTQGLQDAYLKTEYNFNKDFALQADYHYFLLAANKYHTKISGKRLNLDLGQELDLTVKWKIMKEVNLQGGYSFYLTNSTFEHVKKIYGKEYRFPQFMYVMVTVKPTFFSSK